MRRGREKKRTTKHKISFSEDDKKKKIKIHAGPLVQAVSDEYGERAFLCPYPLRCESSRARETKRVFI